jgi:5-methylcytosine-specific restriction endonuclease McrA
MVNLKKEGGRRKIREEAEKRLYGKVKSERTLIKDKEEIFRKFGNKCGVCGEMEGLHIHHKDKDATNNSADNLIVLCGVCHKKIHMKVR